MLEPESAGGVRILGLLVQLDILVQLAALLPVLGLLILVGVLIPALILVVLVELEGPVDAVLGLVIGGHGGELRGQVLEFSGIRIAPAVHALLAGRVGSCAVALSLGQQRGQRPGERVNLVGREHGPVGQMGLLLGEQSLEPQQEREAPAPLHRGVLVPILDLGQGGVQCPTASGPRGKRILEALALVDELLARKYFGTRDRGRIGKRGDCTHGDNGLSRLDVRAGA